MLKDFKHGKYNYENWLKSMGSDGDTETSIKYK